MKLDLFPAPRKASIKSTPVKLAGADWMILPRPCSPRLRERVLEGAQRLSQALNREVRVAATAPQQGSVLLEICIGGGKQT